VLENIKIAYDDAKNAVINKGNDRKIYKSLKLKLKSSRYEIPNEITKIFKTQQSHHKGHKGSYDEYDQTNINFAKLNSNPAIGTDFMKKKFTEKYYNEVRINNFNNVLI